MWEFRAPKTKTDHTISHGWGWFRSSFPVDVGGGGFVSLRKQNCAVSRGEFAITAVGNKHSAIEENFFFKIISTNNIWKLHLLLIKSLKLILLMSLNLHLLSNYWCFWTFRANKNKTDHSDDALTFVNANACVLNHINAGGVNLQSLTLVIKVTLVHILNSLFNEKHRLNKMLELQSFLLLAPKLTWSHSFSQITDEC